MKAKTACWRTRRNRGEISGVYNNQRNDGTAILAWRLRLDIVAAGVAAGIVKRRRQYRRLRRHDATALYQRDANKRRHVIQLLIFEKLRHCVAASGGYDVEIVSAGAS